MGLDYETIFSNPGSDFIEFRESGKPDSRPAVSG